MKLVDTETAEASAPAFWIRLETCETSRHTYLTSPVRHWTLEPRREVRGIDPDSLPVIEGERRLGPCVAGVGKIVCIGLNYLDHADEVGKGKPSEPVIILKSTTSICGPDDPIEIPRASQATDWEVELGVVIGTRAKYVSEGKALDHVAGYCVVNDVSERVFQSERQGQWTKGKSHDTHGPIGPWLVSGTTSPIWIT